MMNGIINVYKQKGYTSHDVVAILRGVFGQKKIGHTGTLDPDAEGVLPICLGKATKLCDMLTDKDKVYETVLLLGKTTDTQDITGKTLKEVEVDFSAISSDMIYEIVQGFIGKQMQIPPMYSALKVNGRKLYEMARKGIEVERKPREIIVHNIQIEKINLPEISLKIHCSKGTYIRTLCNDIGEKTGFGGCMKSLVRTNVGSFDIQEAFTLDEIKKKVQTKRIEEDIIAVDEIFKDIPYGIVKEEFSKVLYNGGHLDENHFIKPEELFEKNRIRVYDEKGNFIGIYRRVVNEKSYKVEKMFFDS